MGSDKCALLPEKASAFLDIYLHNYAVIFCNSTPVTTGPMQLDTFFLFPD
jgi:hypothetical protein